MGALPCHRVCRFFSRAQYSAGVDYLEPQDGLILQIGLRCSLWPLRRLRILESGGFLRPSPKTGGVLCRTDVLAGIKKAFMHYKKGSSDGKVPEQVEAALYVTALRQFSGVHETLGE